MKKLIIIALITFNVSILFGQNSNVIHMNNWDSNVAYQISSPPLIIGYGPQSSALKSMYKYDFFYYDNTYYKISSWADYYLWYTQKFYFEFINPEHYKSLYHNGDNIGMVLFIINNHRNKKYPSCIYLSTSRDPNNWIIQNKKTYALNWNNDIDYINNPYNRDKINEEMNDKSEEEVTYKDYIDNKNNKSRTTSFNKKNNYSNNSILSEESFNNRGSRYNNSSSLDNSPNESKTSRSSNGNANSSMSREKK